MLSMLRLGSVFLCLIALASVPLTADATTIQATSCSVSDMQAAIDRAATGDTVSVPAGSCDWGSARLFIKGKNISVQGAGIDVTTITGSSTMIDMGIDGVGTSSSVTGFTINAARWTAALRVDGDGWRIHHMKFTTTPAGYISNAILPFGQRANSPHGPTGLVDHVTFIDSNVDVYGYSTNLVDLEGSLFYGPLGLGDQYAVYIEDSTYTFTAAFGNIMDCNEGGRWVMRFNAITASSDIESHSAQGPRACRRWEIYQNSINFGVGGFFTPFFIRGGSGTIFGNIVGGGWGEPYISFDNIRSFEPRPPLGQCNGTSLADGNLLANGWPCRDQIGWAQDSALWTSSNPNPRQISTPAYIWNNTIGGMPAVVNIRNFVGAWIQPNRDYYNQNATFTGATGVGVGPITSRPSTCTIGVAYWTTDEGEWNSLHSGADGQLYKCTATNTWTLYYRPYAYPHPLQTASRGGGETSPTPTNLRVQ